MSEKLANISVAEFTARQDILAALVKLLGDVNDSFIEIEYAPDSTFGDFTLPCFILANRQKISPAEVAKNLASQFTPTGLIVSATAAGPYLNFTVDKTKFAELVLKEIAAKKDAYGSSKLGKGKKVMVEYFSPNTNKPLTIGHIRNICLGFSVAKLLKFSGYRVLQTTIYNDRGIAIAKAILGYQKWGRGKTPKDAKQKPDHFVGSFYVKAAQAEKKDKNLEAESRRILQAWEDGKKDVNKTWQLLQGWVLEGFKQTLQKLGVGEFDEAYYESEFYNEGKDLVARGLRAGVFERDKNGVILARLQKHGLPNKIVLRPDSTSLYVTQDLYLAKLKDKHRLDMSVYVVGSEQDLYFQQLFKILELLEFANAKNYYHLSYGLIRLPDGKIKSREGLAAGTGADDLLVGLEGMAILEVQKRYKTLALDEVKQRAEKIALAAVKYYILLVKPKTTMIFDPKKSLSFTGQTGPYLLYVFARINSIFAKVGKKPNGKIDFALLAGAEEQALIKLLSVFPKVVATAALEYDPSAVALYLHQLAQAFGTFYEHSPVLKAEPKTQKARLFLIANVQRVLATGLDLLGIPTIEKM